MFGICNLKRVKDWTDRQGYDKFQFASAKNKSSSHLKVKAKNL